MSPRWARWNTRPAPHARSSRPRRLRYTYDDLAACIDVSMTVGELMGRRSDEQLMADVRAELEHRGTRQELADFLIGDVAGYLAEEAAMYLEAPPVAPAGWMVIDRSVWPLDRARIRRLLGERRGR